MNAGERIGRLIILLGQVGEPSQVEPEQDLCRVVFLLSAQLGGLLAKLDGAVKVPLIGQLHGQALQQKWIGRLTFGQQQCIPDCFGRTFHAEGHGQNRSQDGRHFRIAA